MTSVDDDRLNFEDDRLDFGRVRVDMIAALSAKMNLRLGGDNVVKYPPSLLVSPLAITLVETVCSFKLSRHSPSGRTPCFRLSSLWSYSRCCPWVSAPVVLLGACPVRVCPPVGVSVSACPCRRPVLVSLLSLTPQLKDFLDVSSRWVLCTPRSHSGSR
jgi:hypothetical protein